MPSDYTDYVVLVCDSGERVVHRSHLRRAGVEDNGTITKFGLLVREGGPKNVGQLKQRKLKGGRLYRTMLDRAYRVRWVPWYLEEANWKKPFAFLREVIRKKKVGLLLFQEQKNPTTKPQEPIHISRIAQPSGRMLGTEIPPEGLVDKISPFILKMIVDASSKYRKAYKSYAFGLKQAIMSRWVLILLLGIVGIVMLLYFTGYIRV